MYDNDVIGSSTFERFVTAWRPRIPPPSWRVENTLFAYVVDRGKHPFFGVLLLQDATFFTSGIFLFARRCGHMMCVCAVRVCESKNTSVSVSVNYLRFTI